MNSQPLVCICIPHYNNENTISETLDSIVNQTYENIIIKIFDNASTDGSMKVLKEFESKHPAIQVFQNEVNVGGEANFTKCIENLEGEYGAIFHADDVYMPTIVEEEVKALQENYSLVAVCTSAYKIDTNSNIQRRLHELPKEILRTELYTFKSQIDLLKNILAYGNVINCPSVMARTKIYKANIKEWNGKVYQTSADLDVWLRFAEFGEFGYITKPLIKYRVSDASYSYNLARARTHRHDFFLVIDDYMSRENLRYHLDRKDLNNYRLLSFKDSINVEINIMLQGKKPKFLNIFKFVLIKQLLTSEQRKQSLKTLIIYIYYISFFTLPKNDFIRKVFYRVRFGKKLDV